MNVSKDQLFSDTKRDGFYLLFDDKHVINTLYEKQKELAHFYIMSGDLLCLGLSASTFPDVKRETNVASVYMARHGLELIMKAYLGEENIGDLKKSHHLSNLWRKILETNESQGIDNNRFEKYTKFIDMVCDFEKHSESNLRYLIGHVDDNDNVTSNVTLRKYVNIELLIKCIKDVYIFLDCEHFAKFNIS